MLSLHRKIHGQTDNMPPDLSMWQPKKWHNCCKNAQRVIPLDGIGCSLRLNIFSNNMDLSKVFQTNTNTNYISVSVDTPPQWPSG